jgi:multidrug efflux pump subunit AcrB
MLVKNSIVLVDQADVEIRGGQESYAAVINAAVSRARPVFLGALTTILGVAPLLLDPFFRSMAVTIMFGLAFATLLTLVVVPLLYAALFRIHEPAAS